MPLSKTGKSVLKSMIDTYGSAKKGKQVFYASENKKIAGSEKWTLKSELRKKAEKKKS